MVRGSSPYQEILVEPSGLQQGLEAVLIVLEGAHQIIPEVPTANAPVYLGTPPPPGEGEAAGQPAGPAGTDADRMLRKYQKIGEDQDVKFGEGGVGSRVADFNKPPAPVTAPAPAGAPATTPAPATDAAKRPRVPAPQPPPQ